MATASIRMRVFNGERMLFPTGTQILYRVIDGTQKDHGRFVNSADVRFSGLPFFDNLNDNYRVIVSDGQYQDAGLFPVTVKAGAEIGVDLMMVPKNPVYNFASAGFANLAAIDPKIPGIFSADLGGDAAATAQRWSDKFETAAVPACVLNILTIMANSTLAGGQQILGFLKQMIWDASGDNKMAQDRFFGWADKGLIDSLQQPAGAGDVRFEPAPPGLHPGATRSWKAKQYSEANLQLTFHENDAAPAGQPNLVKVEPDIDYFDDPLAHFFMEVVVNTITKSLTDPSQVLALRWMAEHRAGKDFNPLYTIRAAYEAGIRRHSSPPRLSAAAPQPKSKGVRRDSQRKR